MRSLSAAALLLACSLPLLPCRPVVAQGGSGTGELHVQLVVPYSSHVEHVPAVVWLKALGNTPQIPFPARQRYTLLQKNRMFMPHLLVVPVGSVVDFPNADPFFHNVFSLFDGKRFDLGLYEAGSDKQVTFSREGVSYIFCNIHPEMSAVVIALSTPLFAVAGSAESATIGSIPPGEYSLNIWVEGVPQTTLSALTRTLHVGPGTTDVGSITLPAAPVAGHTNKFGRPYDTTPKTAY